LFQYESGMYGETGTCDFDPEKTKPFATLRGFESLPKNDQVLKNDDSAFLSLNSIDRWKGDFF